MKPIIFSTPMVQAILEGRKTMTRRVVGEDKRGEWVAFNDVRKNSEYGASVPCYLNREIPIDDTSRNIMYPKFDVGDILWVRETWYKNYPHKYGRYFYRADGEEIDMPTIYGETIKYGKADGLKWRPSIHMPREAARILLRVTNVRVERLQAITYDDCLREGLWDYGTDVDTLAAFQELWQNLNAKRGYGWEINPWVWVYEFEGICGKFRESFWPEDIVKTGLFL